VLAMRREDATLHALEHEDRQVRGDDDEQREDAWADDDARRAPDALLDESSAPPPAGSGPAREVGERCSP
jgi:hypothetical protein